MKSWEQMTSRERDALVAEKVMGFTVKVELVRWYNEDLSLGETSLPHYSTNIAAAWEVVEKILEFNPYWEESENLNFELTPTKPKGWHCNFGDDTTRAYASTASEAICLAALRCVGVEV